MNITRLSVRLLANPGRVIIRPFAPGEPARIAAIIHRVCDLPEVQASQILERVLSSYEGRHKNILEIFRQNFALGTALLSDYPQTNQVQRLLLGAYFSHEYSLESAALFNPSMVLHPDQSELAKGSSRCVLSLRACGEGHVSSIEFRTVVIDAAGDVAVASPTQFAINARPVDDALYDKQSFRLKLLEMHAEYPVSRQILAQLGNQFAMADLKRAIEHCRPTEGAGPFLELEETMLWLAHSNYTLEFPLDSDLSERVIFPVSENESRGIEDARFVRFTHPDGRVTYYATCTAYNGFRVLPQLIETTDFRRFNMLTLNGRCVQNKGMALFPRKVGGRFLMAARLDGENIFLLRSDNVHFWNESQLIRGPVFPWEAVQVGNCGSPIETEAGWILLTHGVGPMREYWIGALLLDLDDPSRVIGQLREPLLAPNAEERDGYVPNVVYSCGGLVHAERLVLPYAASDSRTSFAAVSISELLDALRQRSAAPGGHS